jgi:ribosome-binding factor A
MAKRSPPASEPSQRQLRAGEVIRRSLSDVIQRAGLRDPDLAGVLITIGEVRCSPDLRQAVVFVSPLGDNSAEGRSRLARALNRAAGLLRGEVGREVRLKFTPELKFVADPSYDEAARIDQILDDPKVRRDLEP